MTENEQIGVIGLGLMGTAIAERLLQAGYGTVVFNRTRSKAEPLTARGAKWSDDPLAECSRVIFCLFTSENVEEVLGRMENSLRPGHILIDTSTSNPDHVTALGARLAAGGIHYLDAPVSGSSEQTRRGEVTALVGGPQAAFEACRDLFDCFCATTLYAGPCGNGAKMKLVGNLVLGLNRAALAEGLAFAETLGLSGEATLEALLGSMAYSRIMETKGRKMIECDFRTEARLSQHLKDVCLILQAAGEQGLELPLSDAHRRLLEAADGAGFGEADNSAVIRAYKRGAASTTGGKR